MKNNASLFTAEFMLNASLVPNCLCSVVLQREPEREEQPDTSMPPKFKRHLNDDEVTGSVRSERVRDTTPQGIVGHQDVVSNFIALNHIYLIRDVKKSVLEFKIFLVIPFDDPFVIGL